MNMSFSHAPGNEKDTNDKQGYRYCGTHSEISRSTWVWLATRAGTGPRRLGIQVQQAFSASLARQRDTN
jgi:hypothetical protein